MGEPLFIRAKYWCGANVFEVCAQFMLFLHFHWIGEVRRRLYRATELQPIAGASESARMIQFLNPYAHCEWLFTHLLALQKGGRFGPDSAIALWRLSTPQVFTRSVRVQWPLPFHWLLGQYYRVHHDMYPHPHHKELGAGPRTLTVFLYLSDVEEGGETGFPKLNISVEPKKGALHDCVSLFLELMKFLFTWGNCPHSQDGCSFGLPYLMRILSHKMSAHSTKRKLW